jgi:hypothetical protein
MCFVFTQLHRTKTRSAGHLAVEVLRSRPVGSGTAHSPPDGLATLSKVAGDPVTYGELGAAIASVAGK